LPLTSLGSMTLDDWWAGGIHLTEGVFTRADGQAGDPVVTWLHGFPISSWDWSKLHEALGPRRRDVTLDFLGFGASEKPARAYSMFEQADLVEAVWAHWGVTTTSLVAHDYGVSVAQELLARRAEGALSVEVTGLTLFNGGIFPELHRPTKIQRLLVTPLGPLVARLMSESTYVKGYRAVLGQPPPDEELAEHWRALSRDNGQRNAHRILGYMDERRVHGERWVKALEETDLPIQCIWGPEDPVSGAHVIPEIRRRLPSATVHVLDGLGHAPHMEAPARVAEILVRL
jgi:pimeloyl-ACP methyl ester carboxylesterase